MAGSLIKIDEEIVTSAVASVTLTGIDSTYDVYMVQVINVATDTDAQGVRFRFTVSGTPDTSSNYDRAYKNLRADSAFSNIAYTNQAELDLGNAGTGTQEVANATQYLFNFKLHHLEILLNVHLDFCYLLQQYKKNIHLHC